MSPSQPVSCWASSLAISSRFGSVASFGFVAKVQGERRREVESRPAKVSANIVLTLFSDSRVAAVSCSSTQQASTSFPGLDCHFSSDQARCVEFLRVSFCASLLGERIHRRQNLALLDLDRRSCSPLCLLRDDTILTLGDIVRAALAGSCIHAAKKPTESKPKPPDCSGKTPR